LFTASEPMLPSDVGNLTSSTRTLLIQTSLTRLPFLAFN
jgi:hypothetical protein